MILNSVLNQTQTLQLQNDTTDTTEKKTSY